MAAAITGFYNLTGWPDRAPAGPFGAYTDYVVPRFTADRASGRARLSSAHRPGPVHRPVAGGIPRFMCSARRFSTTRSMDACRAAREIPMRGSRRTAFIRRRARTNGSRSRAATMTTGAVCARRWEVRNWRRDSRFASAAGRRSVARDRCAIAAWTGAIDRESGQELACRRAAFLPTRCRTVRMYADPQLRIAAISCGRTFHPRPIHGRRSARELSADTRGRSPRRSEPRPGQSPRARNHPRLRRNANHRIGCVRCARLGASNPAPLARRT